MKPVTYKPSKTTKFFYKINKILYIFGFPNFWIEDLNFPKRFVMIYNCFTDFNTVMIVFWLIMEYGAFFTQHNLTKKQSYNLCMYTISHTIYFTFRLIVRHHKETARSLLYNLTVALKRIHNDPEVERDLIMSCTTYLAALLLFCILAMIMYVFDACMEMAEHEATFTTIVTAYPDVHDGSTLANIVRAICYIMWWVFLLRIFATYILVVPLTTCLSYQYKNLQSYFYGLSEIFSRDNLSQEEKENEYEKQFKVGIEIHSETLRCIEQCQSVCGAIFSGQIALNLLVVVVLMTQMAKSEHDLSNICATLLTATAVLVSTGFFMWNAGDITVEAAHLPTAIYFSGWENCQGESSIRIRKLISITMNVAQRPVTLKGFGYIKLSYQSYLTIVKSSYSVFSVLV